MIGKIASALAAVSFALSPSQLPLDPPTVGLNDPNVAKVDCLTGTGSAFRVGKDYWLSVRHVTAAGACMVDGEPVKELWEDPKRDFAIFKLNPRPGKSLRIDCNGFVAGRKYEAVGHARGLPQQTVITLVATGRTEAGFAVLRGIFTVIPGQSGGVIRDAVTKRAVGAIAVYVPHSGLSGSVELKDTPVCQ
jgi:hypothetical protein